MPPFLSVIRTCEKNMREFMFKQLGQIISIIKQHARRFMPDILTVMRVSFIAPTQCHHSPSRFYVPSPPSLFW